MHACVCVCVCVCVCGVRVHSKNEMVVMTIPYCYFSYIYSLLFVDSSVKLVCMHASSHIITFSYDVYASFICYSIVIIIDVHPTHISLTHGFQGNKHVMDVLIMTHAYVCVGCPLSHHK